MTTTTNNTQKKSFFQGRKMWFWTAAGLGILTLILLVAFLQSLITTTTYYVLNRDVPPRTLITTEMLVERQTNQGGEPENAIGIETVSSQPVYSKTELSTGDILAKSNAGDLIPLRDGIPSDFVIASFSSDPTMSAGGNISRGDYVDIFYVVEGEDTKLLFQRVLIVDASADVNGSLGDETVAAEQGNVTAPYRVGVPTLYTVGLTQEDAAKMSLALSGGSLYVVMSSADSVENKNGVEAVDLGLNLPELLTGAVEDSGRNTDNTFSKVDGESGNTGSTGTAPTPAPSASTAPGVVEDDTSANVPTQGATEDEVTNQ
jgi:hypothetical protein